MFHTLPLLLLAGCVEPLSNAIFEEDADFLSVLPTEARNTVRFEAPGIDDDVDAPEGPLPVLVPDLYAYTRTVSGTVNDFIFQVLDWIDMIRAYPPTVRETDRRQWGPWPVGRMLDFDMEVEILREGFGVFEWEFRVRPAEGGDWIPYLSGVHYAGTTVAEGDGEFTADFSAIADLMGYDPRGSLVVDYDNRDGAAFLVEILQFQADAQASPFDASYWNRTDPTGSGDFEYLTWADVNGGGVSEALQVRSRWTPENALRSDARIVEGDLGISEFTASQCWDDATTLTYQADSLDWFEAVGSESACAFASAVLPEHL